MRVEHGVIQPIEIAQGPYRAELLNLGATLRRLEVPDRAGRAANVVLGFRDLDSYRGPPRFYGAIAGRYANRIAGARFSLDGQEFALPANDGPNSLHSGPLGFDQQFWKVENRTANAVSFSLVSPDGWNGFPGTLTVRVDYAIDEDGLAITIVASTDRATIVNLTNHAYFNLAGEASNEPILNHLLQIPASRFTPIDAAAIPLAGLQSVAETPFDFRTPHAIGRDIAADDAQLRNGQGFDHNLVIDAPAGTLRRVATAYHPASGRVLELHSSEPGVQFYTGNHLAGGEPGTSGQVYAARAGFCLEPQKFPDSPNRPDFPSARLDPGELYRHDIAFRFRTAESEDEAFRQ